MPSLVNGALIKHTVLKGTYTVVMVYEHTVVARKLGVPSQVILSLYNVIPIINKDKKVVNIKNLKIKEKI